MIIILKLSICVQTEKYTFWGNERALLKKRGCPRLPAKPFPAFATEGKKRVLKNNEQFVRPA